MIVSGAYSRNPRKPRLKWKAAKTPGVGLETIELPGGIESLSESIPGEKDLIEQSRRYHALSDPLRITILYLLKDKPLSVSIINQFMRIAGSKLSYHLTVLRESGLIESEYQGNWIIYSLTDTGRKHVE